MSFVGKYDSGHRWTICGVDEPHLAITWTDVRVDKVEFRRLESGPRRSARSTVAVSGSDLEDQEVASAALTVVALRLHFQGALIQLRLYSSLSLANVRHRIQ